MEGFHEVEDLCNVARRIRDTLRARACIGVSSRRKLSAAVLLGPCCISASILVKLLAPLLMNPWPLCREGRLGWHLSS